MKHVILEELIKKFGANAIVRKKEVEEYVQSIGYDNAKFLYKKKFNVSWGKFQLPTDLKSSTINMVAQVVPITREVKIENKMQFDPNAESTHNYAIVPERDSHYVPFGEFKDIEKIIKSKQFFPTYS